MGLEELLFGTMAGATIYESVSEITQGRQEAEFYKYNAAIARDKARQAVEAASEEIKGIRKKGKAIKGQQLAAAAATGVSLEGSTLEILKETAYELAKEEQWAKYAGETEARYYTSEAQLETLMGKSRKRAAKIGAITTGLKGFGTAGLLYGKQKGWLK